MKHNIILGILSAINALNIYFFYRSDKINKEKDKLFKEREEAIAEVFALLDDKIAIIEKLESEKMVLQKQLKQSQKVNTKHTIKGAIRGR